MPCIAASFPGLRTVLAACALALGSVPAMAAGTVVLRDSARLEAPRDVTLGEVADLNGTDPRMTELVVLDAGEAARRAGASPVGARIELSDIRAALRRAGLPTAGLAMSGSTCTLRIVTDAPATPAPRAPRSSERRPEALSLDGPATVRTRVAQSLLALLDVPEPDLRVAFDARDDQYLSQPESGRTVVARPLSSSPASGRVLIETRIVDGRATVAERTVAARVLVRHEVLRVNREVARRQPVPMSAIESSEEWITPGEAPPRGTDPLTREQAAGQLARARLEAGAVLTPDVLVAQLAVRRNELIDVWVYHGGLAVKAKAVALKDGAIGEVIPARLDRQRAPFQVRVEGERRGVLEDSAASP